MSKLRKLMRLVRTADVDELRTRAGEAGWRLVERAHYAGGRDYFAGRGALSRFTREFRQAWGAASDRAHWSQALKSKDAHCFYPGFDDPRGLVVDHCRDDPARAHLLVERGRSDPGMTSFPYSDSVTRATDHRRAGGYDPLAEREAPCLFYGSIDTLDPHEVGDAKIPWELSRFQFVYDLGQAYLLTGEETYAGKFLALADSWSRAHPDYAGLDFGSALEFTFRIHSLCWGVFFFRHSPHMTDDVARVLYRMVYVGALYIERHLSRYYAPNTHLLGEAFGLLLTGCIFPEFSRSRRWASLGLAIMSEEAERQVTSDGMHAERSVAYHAYALEFLVAAVVLLDRAGGDVPPSLRERVGPMTEVLSLFERPDGTWPRIGDDDGGRLFWLSRPSGDDSSYPRGVIGHRTPRRPWLTSQLP